ncbi:MAG: DUF2752 domain-containing protein [Acidobacteria bacterium]|nr:DUF2752 domain-containing protein [Acidobacteriota bacterium]MDW7985501.1 DUF2752 domain-containing protein [Acidobacteriota bacterium]
MGTDSVTSPRRHVIAMSRPPYEWTWPVLVTLAAVLLTAGFGVVYALWGWVSVPLPVCVLYTLTEIPCGTCGTTRAFQALARGHLWEALRYQPLITLVVLASMVATLADLVAWGVTGRQWIPTTLRRLRVSAWTVVLLFLINWAYLILYLSPRLQRWLTG